MTERISQPSEIQSFYKRKTVLITGGSGLIGKLLMEKLLYSCSDLERIYVLLRPKRGCSPDIRVADIFKLPIFERIRHEKPAVMKKVTALQGDMSLENLGLSEEQQELLMNEVQVVFHCAGNIKFGATLKCAIVMNTIGTASLLQLAKNMRNLLVFVHAGTTFCHVDQDELRERVYHTADDPRDVMRLVQWLDESALDLITPRLINPEPNTYLYSKKLAESLVNEEYPNLPCVIARLSVVTPAYTEPIPGWVDNLNGLIGYIVGIGKGVIRSIYCDANSHTQVVPVDFAVNSLIAISKRVATERTRSKNIPVYNVTQGEQGPLTWGEINQEALKILYDCPFENTVWCIRSNITSNKFIHSLDVLFFHLLPAYIIDFLLFVFRRKRFMVRIQRRVSKGLKDLQYFGSREWVFYNTNLLNLWDELSPKDKQLFPIDFLSVDVIPYIKIMILGARQYCMNEKLETLPRARRRQKRLYVIHLIVVYSFYVGILYVVYKNFETARFGLDFISGAIKALPIIGGLLK